MWSTQPDSPGGIQARTTAGEKSGWWECHTGHTRVGAGLESRCGEYPTQSARWMASVERKPRQNGMRTDGYRLLRTVGDQRVPEKEAQT